MEGRTNKAYRGAQTVSGVFKVAAWLVLVIGIIASIGTAKALHDNGNTGSQVAVSVIGVIGGTVLGASSFAFFAYVLDLLRGIEANTFATLSQIRDLAPAPSHADPTAQIVSQIVEATPTVPASNAEDPTTASRTSEVAPGWYTDPENRAQGRYWNGHEWTEHTTGGQPPG